MENKRKQKNRTRRHNRIRATIRGTSDRPRVSIFKSSRHIFIQFINDESGKTVLSSRIVAGDKSQIKGAKIDKAAEIGKMLAEKSKNLGIKKIVFDRGGYKYHGRIKALADGLRAGGLNF